MSISKPTKIVLSVLAAMVTLLVGPVLHTLMFR